MIASKHRFHGYTSLRYVYQHGQTVRGPLCSIKFVQSKKNHAYRMAVVVSKKVHKSAVIRNRIRRRIYEIVRNVEADMLAPYDIVLTVFSEAIAELPHEELTRAIRAQLRQAKIIPNKIK